MLLENLYDGVYFVDPERRITHWNRGAERISGHAAQEVIGSHCFDEILMHVDDAGTRLCEHGCPLTATLADGELRLMYEGKRSGGNAVVFAPVP